MSISTSWQYSLDTEIQRIYITYVDLYESYFRMRDIPVVFPPHSKKKKNTVVLPQIELEHIKRIRNIFTVNGDSYKFDSPTHKAVTLLRPLVEEIFDPVTPQHPSMKLWNAHGYHILELISEIIPGKLDQIDTISISITNYGTIASFELCRPSDTKINIFLRIDADLTDIIFSVLSAILRHELITKYHNEWSELQFLVDWIMTYTKLGSYLKEINCYPAPSLLHNIRKGYPTSILDQSKEIYEQLDIGRLRTGFTILNNAVLYNGKELDMFSHAEKRIMLAFVENKQGVVPYEMIADLVGQDEDVYSLYSISKRIQRLRDKLDTAEIGKHHIKTVRGIGFELRD